MTTTFRSLTPPKYCTALVDRDTQLVLEERLKHFMLWLAERQVGLCASGRKPLRKEQIDKLIMEYVET